MRKIPHLTLQQRSDLALAWKFAAVLAVIGFGWFLLFNPDFPKWLLE